MFEVTYLFVLALAALPLAVTLFQGVSGTHSAFVHRLYRDAAYILAAVVGILSLEVALGISLENYWFDELGQSHRFWLSIEYRVGIFLVTLLLAGLFVGANLWALSRWLPVVPRSAPWIVGFAIAGVAGYFATPLWIPLMRFVGATSAGVVDPVLSKDLSFYLLALPFYDDVVDVVITILCLTIALWMVVGFTVRRGTTALVDRFNQGRSFYASRSVVVLPESAAAQAMWIRHGMLLGALLCLALGTSQFLARYHLVADGHSQVVAGASYADVNFWIPGYNLVVVCWVATALILALAAFMPQFCDWLLMRRSHWLTPFAGLAVLGLGAFVVPAGIEEF